MRKKYFFLPFLSLLFTALFSVPAQARDEVRDYEKLRLLQQATGATTSGGSNFDTRVNALFDVTASTTPAYQSQAAEDQKIFQEAQKKAADAEAVDAKFRERVIAQSQPSPQQTQTGRVPVYNEDTRDKTSRVDASEELFEKLRQEDAEKRKLNEVLKKEEAEKSEVLKAAIEDSSMAPSLANNPFYVKGASGAAKGQQAFEDGKPVIMSRLIQDGFTQFQVRKMIADASTPEELILTLMDQGKTYGEASDLISLENA